jgi:hypothetical protein
MSEGIRAGFPRFLFRLRNKLHDGCIAAFEVFLAFDCDEGLRSLASGFTLAPSDVLSIRGCIAHVQQAKARCLAQTFIFAGETEQVIADGAANRDLFMRDVIANREDRQPKGTCALASGARG